MRGARYEIGSGLPADASERGAMAGQSPVRPFQDREWPPELVAPPGSVPFAASGDADVAGGASALVGAEYVVPEGRDAVVRELAFTMDGAAAAHGLTFAVLVDGVALEGLQGYRLFPSGGVSSARIGVPLQLRAGARLQVRAANAGAGGHRAGASLAGYSFPAGV